MVADTKWQEQKLTAGVPVTHKKRCFCQTG